MLAEPSVEGGGANGALALPLKVGYLDWILDWGKKYGIVFIVSIKQNLKWEYIDILGIHIAYSYGQRSMNGNIGQGHTKSRFHSEVPKNRNRKDIWLKYLKSIRTSIVDGCTDCKCNNGQISLTLIGMRGGGGTFIPLSFLDWIFIKTFP